MPLPHHCHLCLDRTKHKRAAELQEPSGSTQGQQSSGQGIQKASSHRSVPSRNEKRNNFPKKPIENVNPERGSFKKEARPKISSQANITNLKLHSPSHSKTVVQDVPSASRLNSNNNSPKKNIDPKIKPIKGKSDRKKFHLAQNSATDVQTHSQKTNLKLHSPSHSKTVVQDVPSASRLNSNNNSPKKNIDPKIKPIKGKSECKKFHLAQKSATDVQTHSQKSTNQHVSKTALSNKSLSSRCDKGADTPIELIEDFNLEDRLMVHSETSVDSESRCVKGRGGLMNLDTMQNSTHDIKAADQKSDRDLPSRNNTRDDAQKELIEEFDFEREILNRKPRPESNNGSYFKKDVHQQPSTSTQKLLHSSKTKSGTETRASSLSNDIITKHSKKCDIPANINKLRNSYDNSSRRPTVTTSSQPCKDLQIRMILVTPPASHRQEAQDLNNSSPEIIILDSDDDDEEILPPSSSSTSSKRKLSGTSTETDEKAAKKAKFMDSAATASGSLATRLTSESKFLQLFGGSTKTAQGKLIRTQDMKINPASSGQQQSSNFSSMSGVPNKQCLAQSQMTASTSKSVSHSQNMSRKLIKTSQGNPNISKSGTANKHFNKQGLSDLGKRSSPTALNSAIKKNSHMSSNLPKQPEKPVAETSKNTQQAHQMRKSNSTPNGQTQRQKVLPKQSAFIPINKNDGKIAGAYRQQGATTTSDKFQRDKVPSQATGTHQFGKHPFSSGLGKQSRESATVSQWTNRGTPSGFQTARDSKMDSGTNRTCYPKWDINIANSPNIHKDINQDSSGTKYANRGIKKDQHANRGIKQSDIIQCCPLCQMQFHEW